MTSILRLIRDERVNTDVYESIGEARVATFADGSYIVVWSDGDAGYDIHAQRYDVRGNRLGGEFIVNPAIANYEYTPQVLTLAGGGFVIAWRTTDGNWPTDVCLQTFDAAGKRVGEEFHIHDYNGEAYPSLIALADGGFALGWVDRAAAQEGNFYTLLQAFDATGVPAGERAVLGGGGTDYYTRLIALGDGDLLAIWTSNFNEIAFQRYHADGAAVGAVNFAHATDDTLVGEPQATSLADGGFVLAWHTYAPGYVFSRAAISVRQFSAEGTAAGPETHLAGSFDAPILSDFSLTALSDGGYVIAWLQPEAGSLTQWDVVFQRFDALGHEIGDEAIVDSVTSESNYAMSTPWVAASPGGGFVLTWTAVRPDGMAIFHRDYSASTAGAGSQILWGTAGGERLDGGAGGDVMYGGYGDDTYYVGDYGDRAVERAGEGIDLVRVSYSGYILPDNIENVIVMGAVGGQVWGNDLDNRIVGNAANNSIDGGAGADIMTGREGDDWYRVDNARDVVRELAGEGRDMVSSSISYTLPANCEVLDMWGGTRAIGNNLDNEIHANNDANILDGRGGADVMSGLHGDDTYIVDNAGDVVNEYADIPLWLVTYGIDTVVASVSYTLSANVENLSLSGTAAIDATGNSQNNILRGNTAANRLDGGAGADTLLGGGGDDTYIVDNAGDVVRDGAGQGTDTVYASVSFALGGAYIESLVLTGTGDINATGNAIANRLTGNSGNNVLTGGSGADTFVFGPGGGDDTIADFRASQGDLIDLHAICGGVTLGGGVTLTQSGADTVIDLGGGNSITVLNARSDDPKLLSHIVW